jgi:hypothetical protein
MPVIYEGRVGGNRIFDGRNGEKTSIFAAMEAREIERSRDMSKIVIL